MSADGEPKPGDLVLLVTAVSYDEAQPWQETWIYSGPPIKVDSTVLTGPSADRFWWSFILSQAMTVKAPNPALVLEVRPCHGNPPTIVRSVACKVMVDGSIGWTWSSSLVPIDPTQTTQRRVQSSSKR